MISFVLHTLATVQLSVPCLALHLVSPKTGVPVSLSGVCDNKLLKTEEYVVG